MTHTTTADFLPITPSPGTFAFRRSAQLAKFKQGAPSKAADTQVKYVSRALYASARFALPTPQPLSQIS